ncbi:thioesterase family protein [Arenicella sp. 4NH20-0111]|uniref:acyl-CoA thioesterase n=1 Tax=Arenicella sp. 4NH20-0111 TaxID=3127648 RepID=UPI0031076F94
MSGSFTHLLRVRYSECDAQGVVFNAKYAEYVDIAATEFTRAMWGGYAEMVNSGVDNQVVSLTIDWKAPGRFDDVLAIEVDVAHIGNTSYSLQLKFLKHGARELIAQARITYVFVDSSNYTKIPIPADLRKKLEIGANGLVSNHSGVTI